MALGARSASDLAIAGHRRMAAAAGAATIAVAARHRRPCRPSSRHAAPMHHPEPALTDRRRPSAIAAEDARGSAWPISFGLTRLSNQRSRLDSVCGWWCRCHFQKNSLISGTFEPPEMYSTPCRRCQHRRADERLAVGVGQLDLDLRLLARLVRRSATGSTSTLTTRFSGGTTISRASVWTLPSATVTASTKKLGMSLLDDADLLDRALALQANDLRRQVDAVRRPDEQQHRRVRPGWC